MADRITIERNTSPGKLFYVVAAAVYLALLLILLVLFDFKNLIVFNMMGALISLLISGDMVPEPWFVSPYSELTFFLISPGTWAGMVIGYLAVSTWRQLYRGLIPPCILLCTMAINPWFIIFGSPIVFASAIPHSLIGALIGRKLRQLTSCWQQAPKEEK